MQCDIVLTAPRHYTSTNSYYKQTTCSLCAGPKEVAGSLSNEIIKKSMFKITFISPHVKESEF